MHFLSQLNSEVGEIQILPEAVNYLVRYSWPGNIRELKNFIQSTAYLSRDKRIKVSDVEEFIRKSTAANRSLPVATGISSQQADFDLIYRALLNLAREIAEMKKMIVERPRETAGENGEIYISGAEYQDDESDVKSLREMEREMIIKALKAASGQRKKAAEMLGIGERTLYRKLKEYDLS
jgi:DNA-binding NtrC family response regulator